MPLTLHEIMDAINDCAELHGNNRRSKVVSAIAEALSEDDYDEAALETVLDAATDFAMKLTFTRVCMGCLGDCPFDQDRCGTCRAGQSTMRPATAEEMREHVEAEFLFGDR